MSMRALLLYNIKKNIVIYMTYMDGNKFFLLRNRSQRCTHRSAIGTQYKHKYMEEDTGALFYYF